MFVLTVKIKDADSSYKKDFTVYDETWIDQDDPKIKACVAEALSDFGKPAESIKIKISLEVV